MSFRCFCNTKMPSIRVARIQCVTLCYQCSTCAAIEPLNLCRRISYIFVTNSVWVWRVKYKVNSDLQWSHQQSILFYFLHHFRCTFKSATEDFPEKQKPIFLIHICKSVFLGFILIFIYLIFGSSIENFTFRIVDEKQTKKENRTDRYSSFGWVNAFFFLLHFLVLFHIHKCVCVCSIFVVCVVRVQCVQCLCGFMYRMYVSVFVSESVSLCIDALLVSLIKCNTLNCTVSLRTTNVFLPSPFLENTFWRLKPSHSYSTT